MNHDGVRGLFGDQRQSGVFRMALFERARHAVERVADGIELRQ